MHYLFMRDGKACSCQAARMLITSSQDSDRRVEGVAPLGQRETFRT